MSVCDDSIRPVRSHKARFDGLAPPRSDPNEKGVKGAGVDLHKGAIGALVGPGSRQSARRVAGSHDG